MLKIEKKNLPLCKGSDGVSGVLVLSMCLSVTVEFLYRGFLFLFMVAVLDLSKNINNGKK